MFVCVLYDIHSMNLLTLQCNVLYNAPVIDTVWACDVYLIYDD